MTENNLISIMEYLVIETGNPSAYNGIPWEVMDMEQEKQTTSSVSPVSTDDTNETIANMDRDDFLFLLQEIEHK